jgi:S-disulfanyl-L-cysteine oxidoreductase SoxD
VKASTREVVHRGARRRRQFAFALVLFAAAPFAGCDRGRHAGEDTSRTGAAFEKRPAGHYALGRAPTPAEVAAWDIDIGPDGRELPPGRGSARDGAAIYQAHCASCHGAGGEGMPPAFPALIGRDPAGEGFDFASDPSIERTIGNYWSHATTLYDYIRRAMPLNTPGSLDAGETYAVTAFLLAANRIIPDDAVLDADGLRAVRMPARERFVPDDRAGGRTVR